MTDPIELLVVHLSRLMFNVYIASDFNRTQYGQRLEAIGKDKYFV